MILSKGKSAAKTEVMVDCRRNVAQQVAMEKKQTMGHDIILAIRIHVAGLFSEPGASNIITENAAGTKLAIPSNPQIKVAPMAIHIPAWLFI